MVGLFGIDGSLEWGWGTHGTHATGAHVYMHAHAHTILTAPNLTLTIVVIVYYNIIVQPNCKQIRGIRCLKMFKKRKIVNNAMRKRQTETANGEIYNHL